MTYSTKLNITNNNFIIHFFIFFHLSWTLIRHFSIHLSSCIRSSPDWPFAPCSWKQKLLDLFFCCCFWHRLQIITYQQPPKVNQIKPFHIKSIKSTLNSIVFLLFFIFSFLFLLLLLLSTSPTSSLPWDLGIFVVFNKIFINVWLITRILKGKRWVHTSWPVKALTSIPRLSTPIIFASCKKYTQSDIQKRVDFIYI